MRLSHLIILHLARNTGTNPRRIHCLLTKPRGESGWHQGIPKRPKITNAPAEADEDFVQEQLQVLNALAGGEGQSVTQKRIPILM